MEIYRSAQTNGGKPLGQKGFESETGIRMYDWRGKFWARWSDALIEAGFAPNQMKRAYDETFLLAKYAQLAQELRRLPTQAEIQIKRRRDPTFPGYVAFRRLGRKSELLERLVQYCQTHGGYADVLRMCGNIPQGRGASEAENPDASMNQISFVYLMRSGRFYKIGKTTSRGRREYELALQLPEKPSAVHVIRTEDPSGIEEYWHKRFETRRKNGEWFDLSAADVAAFRRLKRM